MAQSQPTPLDARKFAAIAAECAKVCGVDVRLTPLAEVTVQVGQAMTAPAAAPTCEREIIGLGVRFDDEYVIVRLPTGGFRAFKVDAAGRVVLRLDVRGGFRAHVSRVFGALIWDRLKRGAARYEPQLVLLAAEATAPLVAEAAHVEATEPGAAAVQASNPQLKIRAKAPRLEPSHPPVRSAPPELPSESEPGPAPVPEPPAPSAPPLPEPAALAMAPPQPKTKGAKSQVAPPPPPPGSAAPPAEPGAPLARRLRASRSK